MVKYKVFIKTRKSNVTRKGKELKNWVQGNYNPEQETRKIFSAQSNEYVHNAIF